ncbi:MAG: metallophosphoesterase [Bacilli bacterium]|nr:metallophosphoesterase [Bacilli bacterium]
MIYITGDTHGLVDFGRLVTYFSTRHVSRDDILIILGDAGIVWNEETPYAPYYEELGLTIYYIDGNHENFFLLNKLPIVERNGARMHRVSEHIFHILRGEVLHLGGYSFLCLGGATSIDKAYRIEGISYWREENISYEDMENVFNNLEKEGDHFDFVLTHCAPTSVIRHMFQYEGDGDTKILETLAMRISYNDWLFGHYHQDKASGAFRCFYFDVMELEERKVF